MTDRFVHLDCENNSPVSLERASEKMNAWIRLWLLAGPLCLSGLLVGCGGIPKLPSALAPSDYKIQPGDTLEFQLYQEQVDEQPTPIQLVVQPDGMVMIPYIGSFRAAELSSSELLTNIQNRLKGIFNTPVMPHFSINIYPSRTVQVLGFVRAPGQFPLVHKMRATDALALAGGLRLPESSPNSTLLMRRSEGYENTYPILFGDILSTGNPHTNIELLPGDVIYVPPTTFRKIALFLEDLFAPIHALLAPVVQPVTAVFGA